MFWTSILTFFVSTIAKMNGSCILLMIFYAWICASMNMNSAKHIITTVICKLEEHSQFTETLIKDHLLVYHIIFLVLQQHLQM